MKVEVHVALCAVCLEDRYSIMYFSTILYCILYCISLSMISTLFKLQNQGTLL